MVFERTKRRTHLKTVCRQKCSFCNKTFRRSMMAEHRKRCTKNPYYDCELCGKKIKRKDKFIHMYKNCEARNQKVTCPEKLCGMQVHSTELKKHRMRWHPYGVKGQIFCKFAGAPSNVLTLCWHPKQTIATTLKIIGDRLGVEEGQLGLWTSHPHRKLYQGNFQDLGIEAEATLICRYQKRQVQRI